MEESIICLEDLTEVIDLSETVATLSPQHSRDDLFEEFFVREKNKKTRRRTKRNNVPSVVIDLSNESDLSNSSIVSESEQSTRNSIELCCPICFEKFSKVEVKATTCGHVFCSRCIETTVKQTKSCPKCRTKLTMKNLIPLYL